MALVALVVFTALFADQLAPQDPFATAAGRSLKPPSARYLLGTDDIGRDMYTGIVHGARTSMTIVLWVVVLASIIGLSIGLLCGVKGGIVDDVFMRVAEMFQVVPRFFLALLVISYFGASMNNLILLLGLTSWSFLARVVRAETIRLRGREFVDVSRAVGASRLRIVGRHLLPNLLPPVIVVIALFASRVIMIEAGLSFLGLGDPSRISWGYLANNAQQFLRLAWWMAVFPGLAILITVLGLNLLSDALNNAQRLDR